MNQHDALQIENRDEIVARYKQLRKVSMKLNHKLVRTLSKEVLHEGGRKLGILQDGTLYFNTEDESSVLMDYCIYDVRRKGRNAVEAYLIESSPDPESDEMTLLRAMQHSTYSLFIVDSVERGLGVTVRDLRSDETLLVVDIGFGSTAQPGLLFASRLLPHDGFSVTGGAALPIGVLPPDQRDSMIKTLLRGFPADRSGYYDPASLISACLELDSSSHIQYQEPKKKRTHAAAGIKQHSSRNSRAQRSLSLWQRQEVQEVLPEKTLTGLSCTVKSKQNKSLLLNITNVTEH